MLTRRIALRFLKASSVKILIDAPATRQTRARYQLFDQLIIATFDGSSALYRIFDEHELPYIISTGKITGGKYAVKPEREAGASWGHNITDIINGGLRQRGGRLGNQLYLAKLDTLDKRFLHLDAGVAFDPAGPDEQPAVMQMSRCNWGLGCSVMDVTVADVDFFKVRTDGQITPIPLALLKEELQSPSPELALQPRDKFIVTKGSKALGVQIRNRGVIREVKRFLDSRVLVTLGFTYARQVPNGGQPLTLFATHPNRLKDSEIALMDSAGNRILIRKR